MADLDASLLYNGNLGGLVMQARQQKAQEQQQLYENIGTAVKDVKGSFVQRDMEAALQKNFNPETQELNQKGAIADLFKTQPKIAMEMAQNFKKEEMAGMKTRAEAAKHMAEAGKIGAETGKIGNESEGLKLENHLKSLNQLGNILYSIDPNSPNFQEQGERAMAYAKKMNMQGIELFDDGKPFTAEKLIRAQGLAVDAKTQGEQRLRAIEADTARMNAGTNALNAQNTNANAQARNLVDIRGQDVNMKIADKNIEAANIRAQQESPELKLKKEEIANKKLESYTEAENNLKSANRGIDTIKTAANELLNNPLISDARWSINGAVAAPFFGDASKAYKAQYENFHQNVIGTTLQNIRAQSANGASGFGQLTQGELPIVGASGGAMTWEQFIAQPPEKRAAYMQNFIVKAEESVKLNNDLINTNKNKINKVAPKSSIANDEIVGKASNGVSVTRAQEERMDRIMAQQQQR